MKYGLISVSNYIKTKIRGLTMLIDITDSLSDAALKEAQGKLGVLEKFKLLKNKGDIRSAADLLESSCVEPHIYHGHYRELFTAWRQINKEDLKQHKYHTVIERVFKAIQMNDDMLSEMSNYWSNIHKKTMSKDYFSKSYSHIKITDAKNLLKAGLAIDDKKAIKIAENLIKKFEGSK